MEQSSNLTVPEIPPEIFSLNSILVACSGADRFVDGLEFETTEAQRKGLLEQFIFFHHFMALDAVSYVVRDTKPYREYCERMVAAIHPEISFPSYESVGLAPLHHFSDKDRAGAIKDCFFSVGNISICMAQDLYLGRRPFKSELEIMGRRSVRDLTRWDSDAPNTMQYFCAAFIARLTLALDARDRRDFFTFAELPGCAFAETSASFKLYVGLLGGEVLPMSDSPRENKPQGVKKGWLSRLIG
ncbi:MAG: hypothetical protein ABR990_03895 [Terracidiphilus sp.]|jgi:hypothetical protein